MRTTSRFSIRLCAALAGLTLLAASCSSDDDSDDAVEDTTTTVAEPINQGTTIETFDFGFEPNPTVIQEGELVTWVNTSETTTHAIEHLPSPGQDILFSATRLGPGESFSVTPGTGPLEYHCQIHPETMQGGFIVESADGSATDTTATD